MIQDHVVDQILHHIGVVAGSTQIVDAGLIVAVLAVDDVSGDVFAITGKGTYSMPEDNLNFTARVRLFKNDSLIGKLANPITWTFSKLLLEFKVYGPLDDPKWDYISVLERLL